MVLGAVFAFMPTTLAVQSKAISSYVNLRETIRETLLAGQRRIEAEKVRTYWLTGKYIHEHVLEHKGRADYGRAVLRRLSRDLEVSERLLYQTFKFYRAFPEILHGRAKSFSGLTWTHYRTLATIPEEKARIEWTERTERQHWSADDLASRIRHEYRSNNGHAPPPQLPMVCLGPFFTYKVIRPEAIHSRANELLLDLGFSHFLEISLFKEKFAANTIVMLGEDRSIRKVDDAGDDILYTYKAYVERVVDGDTLKVEFDLGFGNRQRETIRLNHIDCPERDTPEGKAAKRFVEKELSSCDHITIKSIKTRREKWGRYLGDVFYSSKSSVHSLQSRETENRKLKTGNTLVYLNQLLLDRRHAVKVRM